jgi:glycosyltransferase involved in cell wall biosynthesis
MPGIFNMTVPYMRLFHYITKHTADMTKFLPYKLVDVEISEKITSITGLKGYGYVQILLRHYGEPVSYFKLPVLNDSISAETISAAIGKKFSGKIITNHFRWLLSQPDKKLSTENVLKSRPIKKNELFITVAVCTRNRTADLELCLNSIKNIKYANYEVVIVDNAPSDNSTELLVKNNYPEFRYVREDIPGLDNARNKAILESKGEIIAYTDDDVIVDELWLQAISERFQEADDICAVTGLVYPYEMETEAQYLFEKYGGFGRGYERIYYSAYDRSLKNLAAEFAGAGKFGTGANMAYRKSVYDKIGLFDPALDVGTPTNGGGDLEMFFRILKEGYRLVYEPCMMVRHRHRRGYEQLKTQITNNGVGLYSYFVRTGLYYKDERYGLFKLGVYWFLIWDLKRLLIGILRPNRFPLDLIWGEFKGAFIGLWRYFAARKKSINKFVRIVSPNPLADRNEKITYVSELDISKELSVVKETRDYRSSRFFVLSNGVMIDSIEIENRYREVTPAMLAYTAANNLNARLLSEYDQEDGTEPLWITLTSQLKKDLKSRTVDAKKTLTASIVIATLDRPDDLKECLASIKHIIDNKEAEVIIVDNNPSSGLTPKALEGIKGVILVKEERKGLSYARNKGFLKASGDIAIALDDDIIVPKNWLQNILKPFEDDSVGAVTGNVLPYSLDNQPQNLFEYYGGLGKGFYDFEVDEDWFFNFRYKAVPTWTLGATANAAFRTSFFRDERVGIMHEALGPGAPSGVGEDTYLFYKILKAGFKIRYNSKAYLRHKHRRTIQAFKKQLYNYSKGHIAYNLVTAIEDNDFRGFVRTFVEIPMWHAYRLYHWLKRDSSYPLRYILLEMRGYYAAPFALAASYMRKRKLDELYGYDDSAAKAYAAKSKRFAGFRRKDTKETEPVAEKSL